MYELIDVDGTVKRKRVMNLRQMQDYLGGCVEMYQNFFINEEGRLKKLPMNKTYPQFVGNVIRRVQK